MWLTLSAAPRAEAVASSSAPGPASPARRTTSPVKPGRTGWDAFIPIARAARFQEGRFQEGRSREERSRQVEEHVWQERLRLHGIEVETLTESTTVRAQIYRLPEAAVCGN